MILLQADLHGCVAYEIERQGRVSLTISPACLQLYIGLTLSSWFQGCLYISLSYILSHLAEMTMSQPSTQGDRRARCHCTGHRQPGHRHNYTICLYAAFSQLLTVHLWVWQVIQAVNPKYQNLDVVSWKLPDKLISARILGLAIQLCQ